jgi:hypothetical protein
VHVACACVHAHVWHVCMYNVYVYVCGWREYAISSPRWICRHVGVRREARSHVGVCAHVGVVPRGHRQGANNGKSAVVKSGEVKSSHGAVAVHTWEWYHEAIGTIATPSGASPSSAGATCAPCACASSRRSRSFSIESAYPRVSQSSWFCQHEGASAVHASVARAASARAERYVGRCVRRTRASYAHAEEDVPKLGYHHVHHRSDFARIVRHIAGNQQGAVQPRRELAQPLRVGFGV